MVGNLKWPETDLTALIYRKPRKLPARGAKGMKAGPHPRCWRTAKMSVGIRAALETSIASPSMLQVRLCLDALDDIDDTDDAPIHRPGQGEDRSVGDVAMMLT